MDDNHDLKLVGSEPFVFTTRDLTCADTGIVITEFIPVLGEPPPDFSPFLITVGVVVAKMIHPQTGQEVNQTNSRKVQLEAETVAEAFAEAPKVAQRTVEEIKTEHRQKVLVAKGPVPPMPRRGRGP